MLAQRELIKNWIIVHEKTGQAWSSSVIAGWTKREDAQRFSSQDLAVALPLYGKWLNIDAELTAAKVA